MFYGFTKSSDQRYPNVKVKKFKTKAKLVEFLQVGNGEFTHADPDAARNYHHDFKYGG